MAVQVTVQDEDVIYTVTAMRQREAIGVNITRQGIAMSGREWIDHQEMVVPIKAVGAVAQAIVQLAAEKANS